MAVAEPAGDGDTVTVLHEYRDKLHWSGRIPPSSSLEGVACLLVRKVNCKHTRKRAHTQTSTQAPNFKRFSTMYIAPPLLKETTKATRGQSQVPDRRIDSRSAGFPPLPP